VHATREVTVRLRSDVALALREPAPTGPVEALLAALDTCAGRLEAVHPEDTTELARWFVVTAPSVDDAQLLRRRLAACEGVEAAYIKGEDAPPG